MIELESEEVTADEVEAALRGAWTEAMAEADFRREAAGILGAGADEFPLEVTQKGDGYDVVGLVLIAASGRVVGGAAERLLGLVSRKLLPIAKRKLKGSFRLTRDDA